MFYLVGRILSNDQGWILDLIQSDNTVRSWHIWMVNLNVNTYWKTPKSSLARARIRHSVVFRNRLTAALTEQWLLEKVPTFLSEKEFTSQGEVILDRSRSFSLGTSQSDLIHHKQIHIWSTPRRVSCCVIVLGKCLAAARKTFATFATWVRLLNFS